MVWTDEMSIRNQLRARTIEAHRVVDLIYSAHDLCDPASYREFLSRHASVLVPMEVRLEEAGVAALVPDWPLRRRTPALIADLGLLHGAFQPSIIPSQPTKADIFGCLYVLEGSRLGSHVLLRRIIDGDDPLCCSATRYLSHGRGARLWDSFLSLLESQHFTRGETERAVAAAAMTFDLFARTARHPTPLVDRDDNRLRASQ